MLAEMIFLLDIQQQNAARIGVISGWNEGINSGGNRDDGGGVMSAEKLIHRPGTVQKLAAVNVG